MSASADAAEQRRVEAVVRAYLQALLEHDYTRACEGLSDAVRRDMQAFAGEAFPELESPDCADALERLLADADQRELERSLSDVEVTGVEIEGDRATVRLEGAAEAPRLRRFGDAWKISRVAVSG